MSDMNDALYAMRDVGISLPESGDAGEDQIRSELARAFSSRTPLRHRRIRLPFVGRTIALIPALLGVTVATAAAAVGASALLQSGPVAVFRHNAQPVGAVGSAPELVIPASAHVIDQFTIPGVGPVQYWIANTKQHGLCQAFARSHGTWPGNAAHSPTARFVGDCRPTREQLVQQETRYARATHTRLTGLAPMSVDEQSVSVQGTDRRWWVIYYGVVSANGAFAVKNRRTRQTAPLINGRYFVMLSHPGPGPNGTSCVGCDNLRAINVRGKVLEADYGPAQYRNH
jgi:hypothetical protein